MADKTRRSQAEKAADSKAKKKKQSSNKKSTGTSKQTTKSNNTAAPNIPIRLISSIIFLALFVLFLIMALVQEGVFINFIKELIYGLVGQTAFIVAIPVFLYLFFIAYTFSKQAILYIKI